MKYLSIILLFCILFSCTRKVHTEKTQTSSSDTRVVNSDSIIAVNKTLSEAYEELLKTTNSTGVVFESQPCDTAKIGAAGVPRVTIKPDGTKEFSGPIVRYNDNSQFIAKIIKRYDQIIDSMSRVTKKDTSHHEQSAVVVVRNVKSTFIPVWIWIVMAVVGLLWINERFNIVKIPFITKKQII
jgi:hypothetical protein